MKHIIVFLTGKGKRKHILYATDPNGNMTLAMLRSFENYLPGLLKIDKIELVSTNSINPLVAKNIEDYAISIF